MILDDLIIECFDINFDKTYKFSGELKLYDQSNKVVGTCKVNIPRCYIDQYTKDLIILPETNEVDNEN